VLGAIDDLVAADGAQTVDAFRPRPNSRVTRGHFDQEVGSAW
jgi:hypothetical protein